MLYRGRRRAYDFSDVYWGDMKFNPSGEEGRADPHESTKAVVGAVVAILALVALCLFGSLGALWLVLG